MQIIYGLLFISNLLENIRCKAINEINEFLSLRISWQMKGNLFLEDFPVCINGLVLNTFSTVLSHLSVCTYTAVTFAGEACLTSLDRRTGAA